MCSALAYDGSTVNLHLNGRQASALLVVDETVPAGVVLVPRSVGIALSEPTSLQISVVEGVIS
jgi:hypothetical protein